MYIHPRLPNLLILLLISPATLAQEADPSVRFFYVAGTLGTVFLAVMSLWMIYGEFMVSLWRLMVINNG
jgi:hypothetical protein